MLFATVALLLSLVMGLLLTKESSLICLQWNDTDVPQCWRPQNLAVIAGLWIVGTVIGIIDTIRTFVETEDERRRASNEPILTAIASANVRRELFRLLELIALFIIGCIAVTGTTATVESRLLVLFVVIMLVTNARLDRHERRETDQLIRTEHEIHGGPRS